MSVIEDVPAFPCSSIRWTNEDGSESVAVGSNGMTLRDWFAGQALAGLMASNLNEQSAKTLALLSYEQADAMIDERQKKKAQA